MTHYDHATAMAYKLDRWSEERAPRKFEVELELLAQEQSTPTKAKNKQSIYRRCLIFLGLDSRAILANRK